MLIVERLFFLRLAQICMSSSQLPTKKKKTRRGGRNHRKKLRLDTQTSVTQLAFIASAASATAAELPMATAAELPMATAAELPMANDVSKSDVSELEAFKCVTGNNDVLKRKNLICWMGSDRVKHVVAYPAAKCRVARMTVLLEDLFGAWGTHGDVSTAADHADAKAAAAFLTYGEVLPTGARQMMLPDALDARSAKLLVDLGCGKCRLAFQVWLFCSSW
jgi:hypothetical protein